MSTRCPLTRKHSKPVMLIVLCIGIIYFAFAQYFLELPAHIMDMNDRLIATQHMVSFNIHQSIDCWNQIWTTTVITKLITEIHLNTKNKCPFEVNDKLLSGNIIILSSFMDHTTQLLHTFINKYRQPSNHITYRQLISLRRVTMIIYEYHKLQKNINYKSFLYTVDELMSQHFESSQKHKIYFNIHISKSGGTSICNTFHNLPFIDDIKTPPGAVCNYGWNAESSTCQDTYSRTTNYDMVAREQALDVFHDTKTNEYYPKLCAKFIYLLPFRHPLEKSYSWAQGDNVLRHDYRTQFYHLNNVNIDNEDVLGECVKQSIIIDGHRYSRIIKGDHYQNFFNTLFYSENIKEKALSNWNEVLQEQHEYQIESDTLNVSLPECMSKEQSDQNWIYIFFNEENKVGAEFMMKYRKTKWPYPGLRLARSSSANTFTSWIGYGDENRWPMSAQLNPRFMIKDKHFINACLLMIGIDYVLPFWKYLDHDNIEDEQSYVGMNNMAHRIWNITYIQMVKHFIDKGYTYMDNKQGSDWANVGHTTGRTDHVHSHNVAVNMTESDIVALRKNNQYDLTLFRLAQWIANVDVDFYQSFTD